MGAGRPLGDAQPLADRLIGEALGEQDEHFQYAAGEWVVHVASGDPAGHRLADWPTAG